MTFSHVLQAMGVPGIHLRIRPANAGLYLRQAVGPHLRARPRDVWLPPHRVHGMEETAPDIG